MLYIQQEGTKKIYEKTHEEDLKREKHGIKDANKMEYNQTNETAELNYSVRFKWSP